MPQIIYMTKTEYNKMAAEKLRAKYLKKTPSGYSKSEIRAMSDDDLLEMADFLAEGNPKSYNNKEPDIIYRVTDDSPPDDPPDDLKEGEFWF